MKVIIETIDSKDVKKYIEERSEPNGHDCWGKTEWTSWDVVIINGKDETIHKGEYIAHDGEKAIAVGFISHLPKEMAMYLDSSLKEKYKKEEYQKFLKLKKEFEADSDENKKIKREVNIDQIIK